MNELVLLISLLMLTPYGHSLQYMFGWFEGQYAASKYTHQVNDTKLVVCLGKGTDGSFNGDGIYVNLTTADNQNQCLVGWDDGFSSLDK